MKPSRLLYSMIGASITVGSSVVVNLLSSAVQQRLPALFSDQTLWILVGLAMIGSLIGYWLSGSLQLPVASTPATGRISPDVITITRFRALLSYSKLKGKGIHLSDILLVGARIDIEA